MIVAGYTNLDTLPNFSATSQLLTCNPKAGLWVNCSVDGADATEQALHGTNPQSLGISSMSIGSVGESFAIVNRSVIAGGTYRDVVFEGGESSFASQGGVTADHLGAGGILVAGLDTRNFFAPGWRVRKESIASAADFQDHSFYLSFNGDSMRAVSGSFGLAGMAGATISGLTFQPDIVFVYGAGYGLQNGMIVNLGVMDATNQWSCVSASAAIEIAPGNTTASQIKNGVLCLSPPIAQGFVGKPGPFEATGAITADGFTVTQVVAPPTTTAEYGYLAVADPNGEFKVGFGSMSSGTSGLAETPDAVLMATSWAADQSDHTPGRMSLGYLALQTAEGPGTFTDASLSASVFAEAPAANTGMRWRSNSTDALVQTDSSGAVLNTQNGVLTADGFTTSPSDGSIQYGWATLRGSFQEDCPEGAPQIYRRLVKIR
jgi:hypothetical protein